MTSDAHDIEGKTPAAWTTVALLTLAVILGTLGVVLANWPLFWIGGVALGVVALVVGKVMKMMGLGIPADESAHA